MTGLFGLNILGDYVRDVSALLSLVRKLSPAAVVVMDNPPLYRQVQDAAPSAIAIYRAYHPHDAEFHHLYTPTGWLDAFGGVVADGYLQCLNEPNGYDAVPQLVTWCKNLMQIARQRGRRLVIGNFGVGHPNETLIQSGAFDDMLRELADGYHIIGLHEYANASPANEQRWHIGRFQYWTDRAKAIGVPSPRIVLTEHGRDVGGGENDGWRGAGLSEGAYAAFLMQSAPLYTAANIPACIFCYGAGAGDRWRSFDVADAASLQSMLVSANASYPVSLNAAPQPPIVVPPAPSRYPFQLATAYAVNLRARPAMTGTRKLSLQTGAPLMVYREIARDADGYTWNWVETPASEGWMAQTVPFDQQYKVA